MRVVIAFFVFIGVVHAWSPMTTARTSIISRTNERCRMIKADNSLEKKVKSETVNFRTALNQVMAGDMGKREFVKSRIIRLARKIDPMSQCKDEEECAIELDTADPALVEMAEKGDF